MRRLESRSWKVRLGQQSYSIWGWLFLFFGVWIRRIGLIFSLPQLAFDLTSTPTMLDSSRHRSSISLTTASGNNVKHSFAKHVSVEHSVSFPRPVITSRREEKNNKAKVFQHPIDSHSQSASSCLINPHFAARAVGVGRCAASFLATESIGTVLIPRLMTRIAGNAMFFSYFIILCLRLTAVIYRFPSNHRSQAPWSGVST